MADEILRREGENILNEEGEVIARFEANNIIKVGGSGGSGIIEKIFEGSVRSTGVIDIGNSLSEYNSIVICAKDNGSLSCLSTYIPVDFLKTADVSGARFGVMCMSYVDDYYNIKANDNNIEVTRISNMNILSIYGIK